MAAIVVSLLYSQCLIILATKSQRMKGEIANIHDQTSSFVVSVRLFLVDSHFSLLDK